MVIAGFASLSAVVSRLIMLYGPMLCFVIGLSSLLCAYRFFMVAWSVITFTAHALRIALRMGIALFKTTALIFISLRKPIAKT